MRYLFISIGSIAVLLGVIGIFLPLLPTTPFLILAATCYAKGSPRFHNWLLNHRVFGSYIRDYTERGGLPLKTKVIALALLWATISTSALLVTDKIHVRCGLWVIATLVSIHLLRMPTVKPAPRSEQP